MKPTLIWVSFLLCALQIPVESTAQHPWDSASDTLTIHEIPPVTNFRTLPDTLTLRKTLALVIPCMPVVPDTLWRRATLAVKTNLLFYGVYMPGYDRWCPMPNVAVEYYPRKGHFTFGASFDCPWWRDYDAHKYFQVRQYQVESRFYLRGAHEPSKPSKPYMPSKPHEPYTGFYVQAYANAGLFGICFDADRGWVGEGIGGGLGLGYVLPLTRSGHWKLEFNLQAGYFRCKYDPYQYENPVDPSYHDDLYYYKWTLSPSLFKKRQYRWNWIGPTRIGITLSYDLLYKRIQKKGVSFKDYEVYEASQPPKPSKPPKPSQPSQPSQPSRPHWPHRPDTHYTHYFPERRTAE
jgi:hypothetical protein